MLKTNKILSLTLLFSTLPMIGMENPGNHRRPVLRPTARPAAAIPNQSKQCQICTDEKPIIDFRTLSCGHNIACAACLKSIAQQAIEQKRTTTLKCPDMRCNKGIEERDLKKIIYNKSQQEEIAEIQLQEWIRQQPGAKSCPTANCNFAFINADQIAGQIDCPNCNHRYCNQCLHPHAQNITCQDAELARNPNAAERATQAWKQQNTKACPHCNVAIEKNEGCLHMTCRSCRYQFCWNCLGDWHTHYDNYNCHNQAANNQRPAPRAYQAHEEIPYEEQEPAAAQAIPARHIASYFYPDQGITNVIINTWFEDEYYATAYFQSNGITLYADHQQHTITLSSYLSYADIMRIFRAGYAINF